MIVLEAGELLFEFVNWPHVLPCPVPQDDVIHAEARPAVRQRFRHGGDDPNGIYEVDEAVLTRCDSALSLAFDLSTLFL